MKGDAVAPRILPRLAATAVLLVSSACNLTFEAPVVPPTGLAFTSTRAPLDTDFDATQLGALTGQASTSVILGLVSWGDASIQAAAEQGGIITIRHADYQYDNILFLWQHFTVIVYGD